MQMFEGKTSALGNERLNRERERELDRLVNSGVYQPCNYSTWAIPIIPVVIED